MVIFNSLSEYMDYVPNCVICGKYMELYIDGRLSSLSKKKPRYNHGRDHLYVKMQLEYTHLRSKHKQHEIVIDPKTNEVTIGVELINRLKDDRIYAHKRCSTCHFKIEAAFQKPGEHQSSWLITSDKVGLSWKDNHFPPLSLKEEELHYTLKGGVDIRISKIYNWPTNENVGAIITLNHKNLPLMPLDFDKFEGLEHLNKRISTIKLFH